MKLFFQFDRNGGQQFSMYEGMQKAVVLGLLSESGATNVVEINEAQFNLFNEQN